MAVSSLAIGDILERITLVCPICSWSPEDQLYRYLFETTYWRAVLAPNQSLVGRSAVHLKRHVGDIKDLNESELVEWLVVVRKLEAALRSAFGATMFNWSCYMNHSFREDVPDPHIHWWAVPRYDRSVTIDDWLFEDPDFGSPYNHYRWLELPAELHRKIAERIQLTF